MVLVVFIRRRWHTIERDEILFREQTRIRHGIDEGEGEAKRGFVFTV